MSTPGAKASDETSETPTVKPKRKSIGLTIPTLPSKRTDDYYEVRIQFSRKAAGLVISIMIIFSRLIESLGMELLNSIF